MLRFLQKKSVFLLLAFALGFSFQLPQQAVSQAPAAAQEDSASEAGNAETKMALGVAMITGQGVPKEIEKGLALLEQAADTGHPHAQFLMGLMYVSDMSGLTPDKEKAREWLEKSAAQDYPKAKQVLAALDASFKETAIDAATLKRDAESGSSAAQYVLAGRYRTGTGGVEKNPEQAQYWLQKAAEGGDELAQSDLGLLLTKQGDYENGIRWMTKAAEHGVVHSQYELASFYAQGKGVAQDTGKSLYWLKKAAAQGDPRAKQALADYADSQSAQ